MTCRGDELSKQKYKFNGDQFFLSRPRAHWSIWRKKKKCKKTGTCLWHLFIYWAILPFSIFRLCPCAATHLASVDPVIILVGISASTFGFMRDSFLCMVHTLLTATPEYVKVNHEVKLLDTGQMSPRVLWHYCLALDNIYIHIHTHTPYIHYNPKPLSWLYIQQWHNLSLKGRLLGRRCSNCFTVQSSTMQRFSAGIDHCNQFKFQRISGSTKQLWKWTRTDLILQPLHRAARNSLMSLKEKEHSPIWHLQENISRSIIITSRNIMLL